MFQFREMKWDDVLHWFAEQQDLTLVMDRTPPGVFTYSDTRDLLARRGDRSAQQCPHDCATSRSSVETKCWW
jgi:hypothetical protein